MGGHGHGILPRGRTAGPRGSNNKVDHHQRGAVQTTGQVVLHGTPRLNVPRGIRAKALANTTAGEK